MKHSCARVKQVCLIRYLSSMGIATTLTLITIAVVLFMSARKGWIDNHTLQTMANVAGIVALVAAILVFVIPAPSSPPIHPSTESEFSVIAADAWQDSKIQIGVGDMIRIVYKTGKWSSRDYELRGYYVIPGAESTTETYDCMSIPQTETGLNGLIGKIGDGKPFIVNREFAGIASESGVLYLRMNDCDQWLFDNDGSITVTIQVNR